jgi:cytochrome b subunit of formate dehydrogenase
MFAIVSIIAFLVVFGGICLHCIVSAAAKGCRCRGIHIFKTLVHLFTLLFLEQKLNIVGVLRKLLYLLALFCFVILLITGFYPVLIRGEQISGYLLMLHATFAPVFAACLAALAVMWADNCRFNKGDWPWLQRILERETASDKSGAEKHTLVQRICFWLIVALALPVILSAVLSMFPFFGTRGQEFLLDTHRYSALLLALIVIVHTYLIIQTKLRQ